MRLLSDFDGVWTDPWREGLAQGEVVDERLLAWAAGEARAGVGEWLAAARARLAAAPLEHGWESDDRISAYADEDPFVMHAALLQLAHTDAASDPIAAWLTGAVVRHGFASLDEFGAFTHHEGVRRVEQRRGPAILPDAAEAGRRLLDAGVDVVVVSNSPEEKLARWFGSAGLPLTHHPERAEGALRLRGGARKFVLGGVPNALELGGVRFETGRPRYREALELERPAGVVGDVFSLDLALPLALRRHVPGWGGLRLFWLQRGYTPEWLAELIAEHAPEVERLDGGLAEAADRLLA
jgi:phosphoserine phosphatase